MQSTKLPTMNSHSSLLSDDFQVRVYNHYANLMMENNIPIHDEQINNTEIKQESGREKIQKHWSEMGGRVCIPEKWGQENFLKDWMDSSLFDSLLAPKGVVSAREALVAERRRENSGRLNMAAGQNGEQVLSFLT